MRITFLLLLTLSCATKPVTYPLTTESHAQIHENSKKMIPRDIAETAGAILVLGVAGGAAVNSK